MTTLKQVIHYADTNSVEATWVDVQPLPDLEIPEVPGTPALYDEAGKLVQEATPGTPARVETGRTQETVVRCHSYADVQMDMLEADLGADAPAFATLIATVRAGIVPPAPLTTEQRNADILAQIQALEGPRVRDVREFLLASGIDYAKRAAKEANGTILTDEQAHTLMYSGNSAYRKNYDLDQQIRALRAQLS